jgi:hypothetical protein
MSEFNLDKNSHKFDEENGQITTKLLDNENVK